ncbi:MAG: glutamine-hydrolyzing carbamoyl-phosphate synthase small subunit [bacterium]
MSKAILMLEDGTCFEGLSAGYEGETFGEIVFNTSMMGYQEILTDPSYKGQIVNMTYTQIGNYGYNIDDAESEKPQAEGFVMKEMSKISSNFRSEGTLAEYFKKHKIIAIEGIDTRMLTRHIRNNGAQKSMISTTDFNKKTLLEKVKASRSIVGLDLAKEVTTKKEYVWDKTHGMKVMQIMEHEDKYLKIMENNKKLKVVAFDCGIKYNILRIFADLNCEVTVVPASTSAARILELKPDGIFISNGPGDPQGVPYVAQTINNLLGKKPIFGICFGHQFLALGLGGKTYKMKFGHRGANHPVMDMQTKKIDITVQNHGFAVDAESFKKCKYKVNITHLNLNDKTVEGLEAPELKAYSVQYHPEASAGPHDAKHVFKKFVESMSK